MRHGWLVHSSKGTDSADAVLNRSQGGLMNYGKWVVSAFVPAMLVVAASASAQVNVSDKTTHVTFNTTVELPNLTLQPGTYTLRLADHNVNRHIVQVYDRNGRKLGSDIHAMAARRLERAQETVVTFHEVPATANPAVRYWYYPNDLVGEEFAYPKDQALRIASATGTSVLAVEGDDLVRVEPATTTPQEPPATVPAPSPQPQADMTAREPEPPVGTSGRRRLPQTATSIPLIGLLGLVALGGALAIEVFRSSRT
jgi:hypothetical protein